LNGASDKRFGLFEQVVRNLRIFPNLGLFFNGRKIFPKKDKTLDNIEEDNFSSHTQWQTHAQLWIRVLELPHTYWIERTLFEIASANGTPWDIDSSTRNHVFGHYARVLVDMDLWRRIFHEFMVEREGFTFNVEVSYEWMSDYCSHCQII